jgi:hypothetical protein
MNFCHPTDWGGVKCFWIVEFPPYSFAGVLVFYTLVALLVCLHLWIPFNALRGGFRGWAIACLIVPFAWVTFARRNWKLTRRPVVVSGSILVVVIGAALCWSLINTFA